MDWANERYVRLYVRDTTTWNLLGWQGQAMLAMMLRKVDRSGVLDIGTREPAAALASHLGSWPREIVETGLSALLQEGVVLVGDHALVMPNFLAAQETPQSDAQRARESRGRRRDRQIITKCDGPVTKCDANVTRSHTQSHAVTPSVPSVPSVPVEEDSHGAEKMPHEQLKELFPTNGKEIHRVFDESAVEITTGASKKRGRAAKEAPTTATWLAYSVAYEQRYGTGPTRNVRVNSLMVQFVRRVPIEEAPEIAAFYVRHPGALYSSAGHAVNLLLRDAEKLRTEFLTGRTITAITARRNERTASNPFLSLVAEERAAKEKR